MLSAIVLLAAEERIRASLRKALERAGLELCEAATTGDVVELALRHLPDVCMLDLNAGGDAIAITQELVSRLPGVKVAMLAGTADERLFLDSMRAGALGYLPRDITGQALLAAVSDLLAGQPAVPERLLSRLVEELRPQL
jgi:NarL family two-component system response regulator LiaR